ncbi:MAG: family 2 glycosyl transferase [Phormidesmis priestleyi Ana]|uniref:4,4'-diaponeurosporenoate glycosyltransferase n=1 Tax=Phormidesmis priestleyi Ana TaxID=1666911 RepID=A0A0N8KNV5_9CYAN|nr:MAG: family 2 glycosyl transferase [Phormidesmis priestleyi Ana]
MFSVVLPCFNESRHGYLPQVLKNLCQQADCQQADCQQADGQAVPNQLIAVVSPSQDETLEIIRQFPTVEVITTNATNRAQRLNVGIQASRGDYVLLHHPATLLPMGDALIQAQAALQKADWGGFVHSFDHDHWLLRFTSWYSTRVRSQQQRILYLDHCIFVRRSVLIAVGGVPDMDIFEDTALSLALAKWGRPAIAPGKVITSARRFCDRGIYRQAALNQLLKLMYLTRQDPKRLNWLYERKSQINVSYAKIQPK